MGVCKKEVYSLLSLRLVRKQIIMGEWWRRLIGGLGAWVKYVRRKLVGSYVTSILFLSLFHFRFIKRIKFSPGEVESGESPVDKWTLLSPTQLRTSIAAALHFHPPLCPLAVAIAVIGRYYIIWSPFPTLALPWIVFTTLAVTASGTLSHAVYIKYLK